MDAQGGDGIQTVTDLQTLLKMPLHAKVLAASFKTTRQGTGLLLAGCESITLPLDVAQQMISSPAVDAAVAKFEHDWQSALDARRSDAVAGGANAYPAFHVRAVVGRVKAKPPPDFFTDYKPHTRIAHQLHFAKLAGHGIVHDDFSGCRFTVVCQQLNGFPSPVTIRSRRSAGAITRLLRRSGIFTEQTTQATVAGLTVPDT